MFDAVQPHIDLGADAWRVLWRCEAAGPTYLVGPGRFTVDQSAALRFKDADKFRAANGLHHAETGRYLSSTIMVSYSRPSLPS